MDANRRDILLRELEQDSHGLLHTHKIMPQERQHMKITM
jgi:hypothetical protein